MRERPVAKYDMRTTRNDIGFHAYRSDRAIFHAQLDLREPVRHLDCDLETVVDGGGSTTRTIAIVDPHTDHPQGIRA